MLGWLPGRSIRLEVVVVSAEVKLLWSFKLARGFLAGQPLLGGVLSGLGWPAFGAPGVWEALLAGQLLPGLGRVLLCQHSVCLVTGVTC